MNFTVQQLRHGVARRRLKKTDFSIISNNCWGAHIYQTFGRQFSTPFVGLFITPQSYLRLLVEFPGCLSLPLKFKPASDEAWVNRMRETHGISWPIGSLGEGIELQFMHYKSEAEACEKWKRRLARLVMEPDCLFFKFCDRDGCTPEQAILFDQLPFRNKVFFTVRQNLPLRHAVKIPSSESCVPDGGILSRLSPAYFDTVDWLNGGSGRVKWWGKMLNYI
jgi:uncharacterized protein (DUF1919 family)